MTSQIPAAEVREASAVGAPPFPSSADAARSGDEGQTAGPRAGGTPPADPPRARRSNPPRTAPATPGRSREAEARAYLTAVRAASRRPSQKGLAAHLRAAGHPIQNEAAAALLKTLTAAPATHLEAVQ